MPINNSQGYDYAVFDTGVFDVVVSFNKFGCDFAKFDQSTFDTISSTYMNRYVAPLEVQSENTHRYSSGLELEVRRAHRYSSYICESWNAHRYSVAQTVESRNQHRYSVSPMETSYASARAASEGLTYSGPIVGTLKSAGNWAWQDGVGALTVDLKVNVSGVEYDLSGIPSILQITHNESAMINWELQILDTTGFYHPDNALGSPWAGIMNSQAYDSMGNYAKQFIVNLTWGGVEYNVVGIPNRHGHTRSFSEAGRFNFKWGGLGCAAKLFRKSQTLPTLRGNGMINNQQALISLLANYSIPCDTDRLRTVNVGVQTRQNGRPGDWAEGILELTLGKWREEGTAFVCYQPAPSGPVQWVYDSSTCTMEESLDAQAENIVNRVTVRRMAEGGGTTAPKPIECTTFGSNYGTKFNPPISGATISVAKENNGQVSDIIWRRSGNVVAVDSPRAGIWPDFLLAHGPINNVDQVSWTFGANPGVIDTGGYAQVTITGKAAAPTSDGIIESPDPVYSVTVPPLKPVKETNASIDAYGEFYEELAPNPLFWNSTDMTNFANDYILRKSQDVDPKTHKVPLNLGMRPGGRMMINDLNLGTSETRYIISNTNVISPALGLRFTRVNSIFYGDR